VPEKAPDFVYTIYIAASAEKVWNGLIDRELTKAYWKHYNESDWKRGSRWAHVRSDGSGKEDIVGRVIEIDPPRRLVTSWALPGDEGDETKYSRVTYEITPIGPDARLTVTHSDLEAGSGMLAGITAGWPAVLSGLKSLLETGRPLSDDFWEEAERHGNQ